MRVSAGRRPLRASLVIWRHTETEVLRATDTSIERGMPVLRVSQFDQEGRLQEAGCYVFGQLARWVHCSD